MTFSERLSALRAELAKPLLVTKPANLHYLTGFVGSNGYLLVDETRAVFVTDGRYGEIAEGLMEAIPGSEVIVYSEKLAATLGHLISAATDVEADHVTWRFAETLAEETSHDVDAGGGAVEKMRRRKEPGEVEALRHAAEAGDAALARLDELAAEAATERDLAWGLQLAMREGGADIAAWDPIVAVGANAARPHHETSSTPLSEGLLLLDYGCTVDGYHSDMTRTKWQGDGAPDAEVQRLYQAVLEAQEAALAAAQPGTNAGVVDDAARSVLDRHGLGDVFLHSTGHGVGLEIHEEPWIRKGSEDVLEPGHVITIEPGAYVTGTGGVRIEDMVLITEDGNEVLTRSPKELR